MAETTRVVLADDDVLLRAGLASLLEGAGFEVVGQAGDGDQLVSLVRAMTPGLVVTDIRMPPTNTSEGLDAARLIRQELPDTAIMVLPHTLPSTMRSTCWRPATASVICSRAASPTWPISSIRWSGSPGEPRWSTLLWWPNSYRHAGETTR